MVFELDPRGRSTGKASKSGPAISANAAVGLKRSLPADMGISRPRRHCRDYRAAKQFVRKRIPHHTHIGLLANLRQGGGRQIFHALIFALFPGQS